MYDRKHHLCDIHAFRSLMVSLREHKKNGEPRDARVLDSLVEQIVLREKELDNQTAEQEITPETLRELIHEHAPVLASMHVQRGVEKPD